MICPKCGVNNIDGSNTCGNCGAVLNDIVTTTPVDDASIQNTPIIDVQPEQSFQQPAEQPVLINPTVSDITNIHPKKGKKGIIFIVLG